MDLVCPEYNILAKAGSSLGHLFSEETKVKMSLADVLDQKDPEVQEKFIYPSISEAGRV
ncbi:hypothetical protein L249_8330, partial [Ophiocordyceps polyrhachis-furcata BCC 54312]